MIDLEGKIRQADFGAMVGISQPAVSHLLSSGVLVADETAGEWLKAYCSHLREQAAGRAASGDLDLIAERAALARAQRERVEMKNEVTRRQLAPVSVIEKTLAAVGRQIVGILDTIPVQMKRRSSLSVDDLEFIQRELVKARNLAAAIRLDEQELQDDDSGIDDIPDGGSF